MVGLLLGLALAVAVAAVEQYLWQDWCENRDLARRFCEIPLDLTAQIEIAVALGILGTVGVVFTILLVSLQLVSQQFSPRLIQMVFQEQRARYLLAGLVSIFVFSMASLFFSVLLASDGITPGLASVANGLAGVLAGVGLVLMLYSIAKQQYIGMILARTARDTVRMAERVATASARSAEIPARYTTEALDDETSIDGLGAVYGVRARRSGWVQQIQNDALTTVLPPDTVMRLETRVGAFIVEGVLLASVWPVVTEEGSDEFASDEKDNLDRGLNLAVYIGSARTMQDDIDLGIRQITDVVLRALSPAVNDPTTAIEGILRLAEVLRQIIVQGLPGQMAYDSDKRVLVLRPWDLDAGEYVRHAFDQIRLEAVKHPAVAIAMLRTLTMLSEAADEASRSTWPTVGAAQEARDSRGSARAWHIRLATQELDRQRRLLLASLQDQPMSGSDREYVLTGLRPQNPRPE